MQMNQNKPHMSDHDNNSHKEDDNEASQPNDVNDSQAWDKVDAVFVAARNALYQGQSSFLEVLDSLIATLQNMKENEVRPLGGLGASKQKMKIQEPSKTEGNEEEIPGDQNT